MKSLYKSLLFCIVLAFFSCSKGEEKIPDDVLTPAEMVPLLVDLQIAQSAVSVFQYSDTIRYNNTELSINILKKRNIPAEKFLKSLKYYSDRPEMMSEIYQDVIDELSKTQSLGGK